MHPELTIALVGIADHDLNQLFYQIKQYAFTGCVTVYANTSDLLKATTQEAGGAFPALIIIYYRADAGLAPDHLRQLRACATLAYVPVVVCAHTFDAYTEQLLDNLEVYATLTTPHDSAGWAGHAEAFIHMCHFWYRQYPEYVALRSSHNQWAHQG